MNRYGGEAIGAGLRIAVIANDAIGNFVVATPLLQMLRRQLLPERVDYYGGVRTLELQDASDLVDFTYALHGAEPREAFCDAARVRAYDLIVNVERTPFAKAFAAALAGAHSKVIGPCLGIGGRADLPFEDSPRGNLWEDSEWVHPDLTQRYPFLERPFIGEIYCRLAYLEGPIPPYRAPSADPGEDVPDVLIATAASLPEKLWPVDRWAECLVRLKRSGISVGLLGAAPDAQRAYWQGESAEDQLVGHDLAIDLRGRFTLPQVVGALAKARAVLTIDNGILHLAVAAGVPTVGLFRHGIHRLWAPPFEKLTVLTAGAGRPVAEIHVETVWEALERAL